MARIVYGATLAVFVVVLVWSAANTDLPQFDGKAMAARFVLFPIAAVLVPLGWLALRRPGRSPSPSPFPYVVATLAVLPFTIDLIGNARRMYIRYEHFDDIVHTVNPILGVAAVALLLARTRAPAWSVWVMAFGLGCAAHIVFEVIEYSLLMGFGAVELGLTLRDTLSDLTWGMLGAAIGACAVLVHARGPRRRAGS